MLCTYNILQILGDDIWIDFISNFVIWIDSFIKFTLCELWVECNFIIILLLLNKPSLKKNNNTILSNCVKSLVNQNLNPTFYPLNGNSKV